MGEGNDVSVIYVYYNNNSQELITRVTTHLFLLSRPKQDVFLLPHIPCIEQVGSIPLVMFLCDLFDGLAILS